ncbi:MAG: VWA domain-containing protein [Synergistaceae bacterium]|nr:VWA domain-containing protein [Synergistaceae bacterium]
MRIANNISALTALNSLSDTNNKLQSVIKALSTGLRINSASDDAAGFAISEKMRSQTYGLNVALRNSQDGISFLQTAEGALGQTNSMLQRMRELAVQASNDSLTSNDRQYLQLEIDELKDQINRISDTTQFNKKRLLDGSSGAVWSSSDPRVKAKINGGLTYIDKFGQKVSAEGNYKIEIKASGGKTQVQKSSLMLIKHKNVLMDKSINTEAGVNNVEVNDIPPGYYTIDGEEPTEAHAFITSSYGIKLNELDEALKAGVRNSYLLKNASILFEVTDANEDNGEVTVRATAQILRTDGISETVMTDKITLHEGKYNDLSEILGVGMAGSDAEAADGAFELQLRAGSAGAFKNGDKFVYNLTVAKDVEDADRVVRISNDNNTKETQEIYKTNMFRPADPVPTSAKVVFLIDNSGSMSSSFATVRSNISAFLSNIKAEGADDIQVGIARYLVGLSSASDWSSSDEAIKKLLEASPSGGTVDPYLAITEAVAAYDMSDVDAKHIVLITDTGQENHGSLTCGKLTDAQNALAANGITLSVIHSYSTTYEADYDSDGNTDISSLVTSDGMRFNIDNREEVQDEEDKGKKWGELLVQKLGKKIAGDATARLRNTPLWAYSEFSPIFPSSSSPSQTLTITQDGIKKEITVEPTDSIQDLAEKIANITGVTTDVKFLSDEDTGERGVSLMTDFPEGTSVKFSGDREFLNILGFRSNFEQKFAIDASAILNKKIHFRQFHIDSSDGRVYQGDMILTADDEKELEEFGFYSGFEVSQIGQIPKQDVCLRDINKFWDSQGVFLLDSPQKLKITQGDGQAAYVTLYENDTIEDVRKKLNNAIANDLGQLKYADRDKFVSYVREGENSNNGDEAVGGTFIIRSVIPGKAGEISFSGDEDLLNALGLNTIQESEEATYSVSIKNAHTGKVIDANLKMSGNVIRGVIDPDIDIEIEFDSMTGLKAQWDEDSKSFIISHDELYSAMLHLKDKSTAFQIGANQGEDFMIQLGDASCDALGISAVNVSTRETASRAISTIDAAINKISSQRAKIGAYENALEHTMQNLTITSLNLTNAESRIRDADISKEMMEFVKLQILNQSGTSMLAQANQLPNSVLSLLQ